jgi:hypothetical protein
MKGAKIIPFPVSRERPDAVLKLIDDVLKAREATSNELRPQATATARGATAPIAAR